MMLIPLLIAILHRTLIPRAYTHATTMIACLKLCKHQPIPTEQALTVAASTTSGSRSALRLMDSYKSGHGELSSLTTDGATTLVTRKVANLPSTDMPSETRTVAIRLLAHLALCMMFPFSLTNVCCDTHQGYGPSIKNIYTCSSSLRHFSD